MQSQKVAGFECDASGVAQSMGLYDPRYEHDSCGVGFVARIDGTPSHTIVQNAIQILINLEHRGAIGGDKSTGDGAGLMLQIPDAFFRRELEKQRITLPPSQDYAVGMLFLPTAKDRRERCVHAMEEIVQQEGGQILGWREVPVHSEHLGKFARQSQPEFRQLFIARHTIEKNAFERKLYVIRRQIENEVGRWAGSDYSQFYICSLSCRTIVYKGMLTANQLKTMFDDFEAEDFSSAFAIVHQRYSTNTLPTWNLAQPFRLLAHNGEINTLRGNINRMRAREATLSSPFFGDDIQKIKPILDEKGSDSAILDNGMELLVRAGRTLPHAAMMMVPEAWGAKFHMSADKRAFYEYHSAIMEPWDGPAALVFSDGRYIGATLDRNGLRPARYSITKDGMIVMASETGVLDLKSDQILRHGRLQPGKMFLLDLEQKRIVPDNEIKAKISRYRPYRHWIQDNRIELRGLFTPSELPPVDPLALRIKQHAFGYTDEDLKLILSPMGSQGQEPVGSMGHDAALAVLSNKPQILFNYFKQLFAQVTNPPIDPLREELVMSLMSYVGREHNLLTETPQHCRRLKLYHPILTTEDMAHLREGGHPDIVVRDIDILFHANGDGAALGEALESVFEQAEKHIANGATLLILTDRNLDREHAAIPALLACSGLHHHLIRKGLRTAAGIVIETGEAREVMHFAQLIGFGANAICPFVAFHTIHEMAVEKMLEKDIAPELAMDAYITAVKKGLLKTFSRMGISTIRSFLGCQIFEAVGLSRNLVDMYFTGTASRIGGIDLSQIAQDVRTRHEKAFPKRGTVSMLLEAGGDYQIRFKNEKHLWTSESVSKLQQATHQNDYKIFQEYTRLIDEQSQAHATLRSLLQFKNLNPIPLDEVEPVENITTRFVTAAMSFGSISKEAHEAIAVAMNRIGGKSNSGEGGEDPARYIPLPSGDSLRSRIKQVASGRFGVTSDYLIHADELQIKIAQGAKPGEGGQLPGHKVSHDIARVRHTTPGVTLISPPPHHDIYSIEDLSQLIFDLKNANPRARVSVKLVSAVGVGTIAAGVAKAKADMVLISGYDGGTGASPLTAIRHCGLPWELGLSETQQTLVRNHLRDRIRVQTDGQLKTGRDLAIAALLGAEEFGFGTTILVTLGCVLMRKCHLNTCPVGIATQDEKLRRQFVGRADYIVNFLRFMAQQLREYMSQLGFRTLDEMVGRSDKLEMKPVIDHYKAKGLDFTAILTPPDAKDHSLRCIRSQDHELEKTVDTTLIELARASLEKKTPVKIEMPIRNVHRTVGTMLSSEVTRRYGEKGLPDDTIQIHLTGSAGQSLGAFLAPGITIRLQGDANDYFGKGMSGGRMILTPGSETTFRPEENIIVGNTVLYGATGGEVFIHGIAGERFAVRNSGTTAVLEGLGDHGCEYMTGGTVTVLGSTGNNFAAGMSGGIAYVFDESELFDTRCNLDMVDLEYVWREEDKHQLRSMIERYYQFTQSRRAKMILDNWQACLPLFVKVMPIEYRRVLERMKLKEDRYNDTVSATEEVYYG